MPSRRTLIKQAVEEMVENNRWMEFERMAVHLGKTKWPEIEATEPGNDAGQDGSSFMPCQDGKRRRLAASLTGTWTKISGDADTIRKAGQEIDVLVFMTTAAIENRQVQELCEKFRKEFGYELHIIPQAEVIAILEQPKNSWICHEYLGLEISDVTDLDEARRLARGAAERTLRGWSSFDYDWNGAMELELRTGASYGGPPQTGGESSSIGKLSTALAGRQRIAIIGLPGAGKTITLLQLAERMLRDRAGLIPFVISIPGWLSSGQTLMEYMDALMAPERLHPGTVAQLVTEGRIALLLNGWNEAPEDNISRAGEQLGEFVRTYPGAPVAIATRHTRIPQPIRGLTAVVVQPLSPSIKEQIVRRYRLADPNAFLRELRRNRDLDQLTDTPLFLSVALSLAQIGTPLPTSKAEILGEFIDHLEQAEGRMAALVQGPCSGHHRLYLAHLASAMTSTRDVFMAEDVMLEEIARCGRQLRAEGHLSDLPTSPAVLDALVRHHILVLAPGPVRSYGFQHQQFQEWFAAQWLVRRVAALPATGDREGIGWLQQNILDQPVWTEPLSFAMEVLRTRGQSSIAADIIRWVIPVDLIAASELAGKAGLDVWESVRGDLIPALREWRSGRSYAARHCAMTAMLATGSADFAQDLWPAIESDNQDAAYEVFRTAIPLRLSVLGPDLDQRFWRLHPARRALVLVEMGLSGGPAERDFVRRAGFSAIDPDTKTAALTAMVWYGDFKAVTARLLEPSFGPWSVPIYRNVIAYLPDDLARGLHEHALADVKAGTDLAFKRAVVGFLRRLGDSAWLAPAKEGLVAAWEACRGVGPTVFSRMGVNTPEAGLVTEYLLILFESDPAWTSSWLVANTVDGLVWEHPFANDLRKLREEDLEALTIEVLAQGAGASMGWRRLNTLVELGSPAILRVAVDSYLNAPVDPSGRRDRKGDLRAALRDAPLGPLIDCILEREASVGELQGLLSLLDLISPQSPLDTRLNRGASPAQKTRLRDLCHRAAAILGSNPVNERWERAHIAMMLGAIGNPSDVVTITTWISGEQERWFTSRREWAAARAAEPAQRRQAMRPDITDYWNWYIGALVQLQCPEAENALRALLESPLTLGEAASGLYHLGVLEDLTEPDPSPFAPRQQFPLPRTGSPPLENQILKSRADAIVASVERAAKALPTDPPVRANLLQAIAVLGQWADPRALQLILESSKDFGRGGAVTELYYGMAFRGYRFPARFAAETLEPFISEAEKPHFGSNDPWYRVVHAIAILLFSDDPSVGVERIRRLPPERVEQDGEGIFQLLIQSPAPEAADLLLEFSDKLKPTNRSFSSLLSVLAQSSDFRCRERLADILAAPGGLAGAALPVWAELTWPRNTRSDPAFQARFQQRVADLAPELIQPQQLHLLADFGTAEAFFIVFTKAPAGSHLFQFAVNQIVVRRKPAGNGNTYYLIPREQRELKRRLYDIAVNDAGRRGDAIHVLNLIRVSRLEYGQPMDEPYHPDVWNIGALPAPWPLIS
jgi:hypothetical protein